MVLVEEEAEEGRGRVASVLKEGTQASEVERSKLVKCGVKKGPSGNLALLIRLCYVVTALFDCLVRPDFFASVLLRHF